jgi:hypothetical protein
MKKLIQNLKLLALAENRNMVQKKQLQFDEAFNAGALSIF